MEQRTVTFTGSGGIPLVGDEWGERELPSVLLLHGGGQTRHSWKDAGRHLARAGLHVVSLDLRGHGDSAWAEDGDYGLETLRADIVAVLAEVGAPVTLIGASLGGMTSLLVTAARSDLVHRLVLVDIVVRIEPEGVDRIREFMHSAPHGFASLEEAAEAVAAYLPHREKPRSPEGLRKNLRRRDGRWYWHWDPRMFEARRDRKAMVEQLDAAARSVQAPTLLVRGGQSDIVSDAGVEHLQQLIAHVEVTTIGDAAHTAAADDNDAFTDAVLEFVLRPDEGAAAAQQSPAKR